MQQSQRRLIEEFTIVENVPKTIDIPKVLDIESLLIEMDAVITLTGAGASVRTYAPAQLLKSFDFIADGKDVLDSVPSTFTFFGNYKRRFAKEITAPANATAIAHTVRAVGFLDRANINGWRPKDTNLQAYNTSLLQLRMLFGLGTDCFITGGALAGTVTSGTVKVYAIEVNETAKANGTTDRDEPKRVVKRTRQEYAIAGANSNFGIQLPVGNHIRLVELCVTDTTTKNPLETALNGAILAIDGVDVRHNMKYKATRSMNAADLGIPVSDLPGGFMVIDSSPRGKFSDYYHLDRGVSECKLTLDVGAACTVEVVVEEDIAALPAA